MIATPVGPIKVTVQMHDGRVIEGFASDMSFNVGYVSGAGLLESYCPDMQITVRGALTVQREEYLARKKAERTRKEYKCDWCGQVNPASNYCCEHCGGSRDLLLDMD